ncbi:hypothetical protein BGZ72_006395 [Mortierella alpina]|nr:hypothetical protein BGZ72_006395 [Mortierella alpina]
MQVSGSDTAVVEGESASDLIHDLHDSNSPHNGSSSVSDADDSPRENLDFKESVSDRYDIQVAPRRKHKSKPRSLKRRPDTKILLPIRSTSRKHYAFPTGVLDRVCSHLSQATLRCAVSLVCKEWNSVSARYIRRMGVWKDPTTEQENRLLEHMPSLHTLVCWFGIKSCTAPFAHNTNGRGVLLQSLRASLDQFLTNITDPLPAAGKDQTANRIESKCLFHHIRRLVLRGSSMTYEASIPLVLGQLQFLQSLELHVECSDIPLFELLNNSPSLTDLKIVGKMDVRSRLLSGDDEDLIPEEPGSFRYHANAHLHNYRKPLDPIPPKSYRDRYRLRSFDIKNIVVKQRVLERVITTCPELRVFKLHEINNSINMPELSVSKFLLIDEERLWNHLKNCCPKIDWYHISLVAKIRTNDERMEALERLIQCKTLGRFLTTTCTTKWPDFLEDLDVRKALRHVTVLEVLPTVNHHKKTESLQQLLCLMPNLLHLIAPDVVFVSPEVLVLPGCARPEGLRKEFIHNKRDRKRQEREEKRQQRQKALERFHVLRQDRLDAIPDIWQCKDLRTMDIKFGNSIDNFSVFTQYVEAHRLLRNLTSLSINVCELRVEVPYEYPTYSFFQPPPKHNDFLLLRGLRCLEKLDIKANTILGIVYAKNFWFLRKQNDAPLMLFIADKNKDAGSDLEEESASTVGYEQRKDRTFWPRLQSLHIKYHVTDADQPDFVEVVAGIEQIRPGVEFVIRQFY